MAKRKKAKRGVKDAQAHGIANLLRGTSVKGHVSDHYGGNLTQEGSGDYRSVTGTPASMSAPLAKRSGSSPPHRSIPDRQHALHERSQPPKLNISS